MRHPQGRIELKDRSKDIIISGGENIASQEVEVILANHDQVGEVGVVAMADEGWGEVPVAFVTLRNPSSHIIEKNVIAWARNKLAGFQTPKKIIVLQEMPKTATNKINKLLLRKWLDSGDWKGK